MKRIMEQALASPYVSQAGSKTGSPERKNSGDLTLNLEPFKIEKKDCIPE